VRATGNAQVQLDGELVGKLPMSFEIAPDLIEVFVPSQNREQ
jgi:diacylglycerol kinase family enzyme